MDFVRIFGFLLLYLVFCYSAVCWELVGLGVVREGEDKGRKWCAVKKNSGIFCGGGRCGVRFLYSRSYVASSLRGD